AELLPEWLTAVVAASQRVPAEFIPALLERGRTHETLRDLLLPAVGERGRWLAAQNDEWSYVSSAEEDEAIWETGTQAQRLAFLKGARLRDAARALELLSATWQTEAPKERAEFIKLFAYGLSLADETFLEAALDDKRKEVRQAAAELLWQLPASALCQRMRGRALPLLQFKRKWL